MVPNSTAEKLPWSRYGNISFWVDEAIWGHRLYDEQSPMLILLELLNVMDSQAQLGARALIDSTEVLDFTVLPRRSLVTRAILFNNPESHRILLGSSEDQARWDMQVAHLARVLDHKYYRLQQLRETFSSYEVFTQTVDLLRSTSLEMDSNKRWTSKFLFPFSSQALYEDLEEKGGSFSNDRRFFGRSGELAYLMLSRSAHRGAVSDALNRQFFKSDSFWSMLVERLRSACGDTELELGLEHSRAGSPIGYLPYERGRLFDIMAEDVIGLLDAGLPGFDAIPLVAKALAFHLANYILCVSAGSSDGSSADFTPIHYVLEIGGRRPNTVRRLARHSWGINNDRSAGRLRRYIDELGAEASIAAAITQKDRSEISRAFQVRIGWQTKKLEENDWNNPLKALQEQALLRHNQHLGKCHHVWMRDAGLASREGTTAYRYAPTDEFLKLMVYANVGRRMEFSLFLNRLYQRYGFIVGERHAIHYKGQTRDTTDFTNNERRLQERLHGLGLLRFLSDACSYVINPYRESPFSLHWKDGAGD